MGGMATPIHNSMLSHARHTAGASVLSRAGQEGMDPNSSGDCFERGCGEPCGLQQTLADLLAYKRHS